MKCPDCNNSSDRIVKLAGFKYLLQFLPASEINQQCGEDSHGCCDHPMTYHPKMAVDSSLEGMQRMDIIIHEMLHGAFPQVAEKVIRKTATEIARILSEDGYRR